MSANLSGSISLAGLSFTAFVERGEDNAVKETLPKAYEGEVTLNGGSQGTPPDYVEITLSTADHGIEVDDYVTVFLATKEQSNYCKVGSVTDEVIGVTDQDGTNLPADETAVIVGKAVEVATEYVGNDVVFVAAEAPAEIYVRFEELSVMKYEQDITPDSAWFWFLTSNPAWTNPFADSTIDKVCASTASIVTDQDFKLGLQFDSVV